MMVSEAPQTQRAEGNGADWPPLPRLKRPLSKKTSARPAMWSRHQTVSVLAGTSATTVSAFPLQLPLF
jgi:hypothetical protein